MILVYVATAEAGGIIRVVVDNDLVAIVRLTVYAQMPRQAVGSSKGATTCRAYKGFIPGI